MTVENTNTETDEDGDALLNMVLRAHQQSMVQPSKLEEEENQKTRKTRSLMAGWGFILGAGGG